MSWTWMSKVCGFFLSRRTDAPSTRRRADAAASEELLAAIEGDALPGRDASLRGGELHRHRAILAGVDDTPHRLAARAHLCFGLERAIRGRRARDPGDAVGLEAAAAEKLLRADDDPVAVRIDVEDVLPRARGDPEAPALPHRVAERAGMRSDDGAGRVDEVSLADEVGSTALDECRVVSARHEAHLLGVRLACHRQSEPLGMRAGLVLRHPPEREQRPGELPLPEHVEDVGLVLARIRAAEQMPPAVVAMDVPRVVAGRDEIDPELAGAAEERAELDLLVASNAGVRRSARVMLVEEVGQHRPLERLREVDDLERKARDASDVRGVGARLRAAAAVLHTVEMDEVHVRSENLVALLLQETRGHGGVHTAGHGDENGGTRAHSPRLAPRSTAVRSGAWASPKYVSTTCAQTPRRRSRWAGSSASSSRGVPRTFRA